MLVFVPSAFDSVRLPAVQTYEVCARSKHVFAHPGLSEQKRKFHNFTFDLGRMIR